jgi:Galactose oxidase, central domain
MSLGAAVPGYAKVSALLMMAAAATAPTLVTPLKAHWGILAPEHRVEPKRSGHTAFVHDNVPFVFGGYAEIDNEAGKRDRFVVNDLWKWTNNDNNGTSDWKLVTTSGDIPRPRLVTVTALGANNKAYMFGGWDPENAGTGGVILDTVHELDIASATWTELTCRMPDGPTSRHVAVALPRQHGNDVTNRILLHTHRCLNYVWLFDPSTQTFARQATSGPCPSARGLHAAVLINDETLCLFGGAAQDQTMSNETFLLDLNTWTWTKLLATTADHGPTPRAGASLVRWNSDCILLFGGAEAAATGLHPRADVWALSLQQQPIQWNLLIHDEVPGDATTIVPPPRNAATLTPISPNELLLTGGWAPFRETWDDCYVLHISPDQ